MPKNIRAHDGAYMLNGDQFKYTKDELNRPVLNVIGQSGGSSEGDFKADGSVPMEGNLQMNGHAIFGVHSLSNTEGTVAIEAVADMNNHKVTNVATPTANTDAVNKQYVDNAVSTEGAKYLSLAGGTMTPLAKINGSSVLTVTAGDKADVTLTDNGAVFVSGKMSISLLADNDNVSVSINKDGLDAHNNKILNVAEPVNDTDAATKAYVDEHSVLGTDGKIDSELDMNEHAIVNVHKISTNGPAPLYIGPTIESGDVNVPRLTGATDGSAAFVKASTQSEYVPISVGAPTDNNHAATKEYADGKINAVQASALLKSGGKMVGSLILKGVPTEDNEAATKAYVDAILPAWKDTDTDKLLGIDNGKLVWVDVTTGDITG